MSDSSDADDPPHSEATSVGELRTALGEGDPRRVSALIEAGADIHYKRDHGYDALLDAVHRRDVARDPRLLELLALLVAHGVDLSGVSAHANGSEESYEPTLGSFVLDLDRLRWRRESTPGPR
jgi:hypothetical protein